MLDLQFEFKPEHRIKLAIYDINYRLTDLTVLQLPYYTSLTATTFVRLPIDKQSMRGTTLISLFVYRCSLFMSTALVATILNYSTVIITVMLTAG